MMFILVRGTRDTAFGDYVMIPIGTYNTREEAEQAGVEDWNGDWLPWQDGIAMVEGGRYFYRIEEVKP